MRPARGRGEGAGTRRPPGVASPQGPLWGRFPDAPLLGEPRSTLCREQPPKIGLQQVDLGLSCESPYSLCSNSWGRGVKGGLLSGWMRKPQSGGKGSERANIHAPAGLFYLLSAINGSPAGEKMLAGWKERTDLHLSLQLTPTTPTASRNDHWCRLVWRSQQVCSAFLLFLLFFIFFSHFFLPFPFCLQHDTQHGDIAPPQPTLSRHLLLGRAGGSRPAATTPWPPLILSCPLPAKKAEGR